MADTMKGLKRTHYCTALGIGDIGKEVVVAGWVQKARNLGNLMFVDLRDRTGILQLAFDDAHRTPGVRKSGDLTQRICGNGKRRSA